MREALSGCASRQVCVSVLVAISGRRLALIAVITRLTGPPRMTQHPTHGAPTLPWRKRNTCTHPSRYLATQDAAVVHGPILLPGSRWVRETSTGDNVVPSPSIRPVPGGPSAEGARRTLTSDPPTMHPVMDYRRLSEKYRHPPDAPLCCISTLP